MATTRVVVKKVKKIDKVNGCWVVVFLEFAHLYNANSMFKQRMQPTLEGAKNDPHISYLSLLSCHR